MDDVLTGGSAYDPDEPRVRTAIDHIDSAASHFRATLHRGGRSYLWEDLNFESAARERCSHLYLSYERLQQMALAHASTGSSLAEDPDLLADIVNALDWLYENKYNEGTEQYGSWFHWEIATPCALTAIATMLYSDLDGTRLDSYMAAVDRWCPQPAQTGANRMWRCAIVAVRGALVEDGQKLSAGRDGIAPVLAYATSGDGFYTDGSFIQHDRHPYTGGYGVPLLIQVARTLYLLDGSLWEVTDPNRDNLLHWAVDGYEPWLYKGSMMNPVRGRQIARRDYQDHVGGHDVVRSMMWLAESAEPTIAERLTSLVKHTIAEDTFSDFFSYRFGTSNRELLSRPVDQVLFLGG